VYEVNQWLWKFGRGKPRLGGLTVDETAMRKNTVREDNTKRSAEMRHIGFLAQPLLPLQRVIFYRILHVLKF
jgi:hypothetical protein